MISQLSIKNYKSIESAQINFSRFTVLIGENGAGKSNILEALVIASAASKGNLERELLIGRGVRVSSPQLMRSAFTSASKNKPIVLSVSYDEDEDEKLKHTLNFIITHDGEPYSDWKISEPEKNLLNQRIKNILQRKISGLSDESRKSEFATLKEEIKIFDAIIKEAESIKTITSDSKKYQTKTKPPALQVKSSIFSAALMNFIEHDALEKFTVYSPDYYTLRNFVSEGQTAPLGTRGEGLLKLLATMQKKEPDRLEVVNDGLKILGWYKEIDFDALSKSSSENRLLVKDRFIRSRGVQLDQISTNEGFLFCLFYLVLFSSSNTPRAFAIENIESGLNPKLIETLVKKLKELGIRYGKQAIISTHSPSVLDALNLDDNSDSLLAIDRNLDGHTRVSLISKPRSTTGKITRLSDAFLKGLLGGMPRNFV